MNPVLKIKQLLGGEPVAVTGTVIAVDGQAVRVRTSRGVVDAKSVENALRVNDEVLLRDGIVQGRVRAAAGVPVYFV